MVWWRISHGFMIGGLHFATPLLGIIARYGFSIKECALLYQALLSVYEQSSTVNSVGVDDWRRYIYMYIFHGSHIKRNITTKVFILFIFFHHPIKV